MAFINPFMPRVLNRITPQRLELAMLLIKERRKRIRYLGSMWQHFGDRHFYYSCMGGHNGSRIVLSKTHSRHQYFHPGLNSRLGDKQWSVRQVKVKGTQYDLPGGFTRNRWDQSIGGTSVLQDSGFKHNFRGLGKNECIEFLEQWGMKYVIMDELRRPSVVDTMYWKHKLYTHNFPWIRDPTTNHRIGDVDHSWKGQEKLDYTNYGATTKDPKNAFTSLWRKAVEELQEPVAAVASTKSKGATKTA